MKLTKNKEENAMKNNKRKVFVAALAICLVAIISLGTLAWFSDSDEVTNNFYVAGSEDGNPDDIFSVDVWEDLDKDGVKDETDGEFNNILPGDVLEKVVHVENTGSYDQYIRVKIEVSNASIWQDVYDANMVPVTEFVDVDLAGVYGVGSYLEGDSFVYYLYYSDILPFEGEDDMIVFEHAYIAEELTKEQAAQLAGKFSIKITADAVQTENVGADVYEAFTTVGMAIETNTTWVATEAELLEAVAGSGYVVMTDNIKFSKEENAINGIVNLYLGDYTLSANRKNSPDVNILIVNANGELTIGGLGTVYMPGSRGIYVNGIVDIYGGNFVDDYDASTDDKEALINVYETGVLNIYGGNFSGVEHCVYVRNGNGSANVYGGVFAVAVEGNEAIVY